MTKPGHYIRSPTWRVDHRTDKGRSRVFVFKSPDLVNWAQNSNRQQSRPARLAGLGTRAKLRDHLTARRLNSQNQAVHQGTVQFTPLNISLTSLSTSSNIIISHLTLEWIDPIALKDNAWICHFTYCAWYIDRYIILYTLYRLYWTIIYQYALCCFIWEERSIK